MLPIWVPIALPVVLEPGLGDGGFNAGPKLLLVSDFFAPSEPALGEPVPDFFEPLICIPLEAGCLSEFERF